MTTFLRGQVKKIIVEVEYPDGSSKVAEISDPEQVAMIAFDERYVRASEAAEFNVSATTWRENPAMMVYPKEIGKQPSPFCRDC